MTTTNHTPEQQATCQNALEKNLKEFLSVALGELQNRILLEMKNMMLENNNKLYENLGKQEMELMLVKRDIENIKSIMLHEQNQLNQFKKETRERIGELTNVQSTAKGAIGLGQWLIGTGIVGGVISIIVTVYAIFGGK